jgi:altronate hydrolase
MQSTVLKLHPNDNVLIALRDLHQGETIDFFQHSFALTTDVPAKHKFATEDLSTGAVVRMYGVMVGKATESIQRGAVLNTRNLRHDAMPFGEKSTEHHWTPLDVTHGAAAHSCYHRSDGQVGTRNYWLVVPLVFCENRNIEVLKQAFEEELGFAQPKIYRQQVAELVRLYQEGKLDEIAQQQPELDSRKDARPEIFKNVDGIKFLMHQSGCGGTREDGNNLCALIASYLHHPNVAGATVLSLGCQHAQIKILRDQLKARDPNFSKPLVVLEQQQSGPNSHARKPFGKLSSDWLTLTRTPVPQRPFLSYVLV